MSFEQSKFENPQEESKTEKEFPRVEEHERAGGKVVEMVKGVKEEGGRVLTELEDVVYKDAEGSSLSLKTLLPPGWEFGKIDLTNEMRAEEKNKKVVYGNVFFSLTERVVPAGEPLPDRVSSDKFRRRVVEDERKVIERKKMPHAESPGFLLFILHEIGHAHSFEALGDKEKEEKLDAMKKLQELRRVKPKDEFSPEEKDLYERVTIKNEKDVWAWALKTVRRLEKEGINLGPELSSTAAILKTVEDSIATYESGETREEWERRRKRVEEILKKRKS